jgi:hypothetical protein
MFIIHPMIFCQIIVQVFGMFNVHDEIESLHKQAIIDLGKFVLHDSEIEGFSAVAVGAAEGVAAKSFYLGIGSIIDAITGGGGDTPPTLIDFNAVNHLIYITVKLL